MATSWYLWMKKLFDLFNKRSLKLVIDSNILSILFLATEADYAFEV